jgi:hypothetical protein
VEGESGGVRVEGGVMVILKLLFFFILGSYDGSKMGLTANKLSIEIQTN